MLDKNQIKKNSLLEEKKQKIVHLQKKALSCFCKFIIDENLGKIGVNSEDNSF